MNIHARLPYFMAANQWQYAQHITIFAREEFLSDAEEKLLDCNHVCRHKEGFWNGVSGDQFGEQTYIRYGKSKGGLVGISLSEDQVASWVLYYPICNFVSLTKDTMFDDSSESDEETCQEAVNAVHKEEGVSRMKLDAEDREKIEK